MNRSTARWTTALAAAALLGLPVSGAAQSSASTPAAQQPASAQPPSQPQPETQSQAGSPQEHLRQAQAALKDIPAASLTGRAKTRVAELKQHLSTLEKTAGASNKASETGAANRSPRSTASRGKANWSNEVAAADKILTELLGSASTSTTGTSTGATGATGTSGSASAKSQITLDETARTKLMEVRTHLTAFAAAMSGTAPSSSDAAEPESKASAAPSPTAGTPGATGSMGSTPPQSNADPVATGTTGQPAVTQTGNTPPATEQPQTPTAGAQQPQADVDAEAAKRHLTAARDTLSQLTQLPAAAQLTGEARTQVSQLISNFNELITTNTEWRASYDKLAANLTALIGAQTTDESATPTSSTAGAVGTSGTAAGSLDPAIRTKLMEFRSHLQQFEKAAGGAGAGNAPSAASAPSATPTPSTSSTGSMTSPTPATESAAGQPSATQSTPPSQPANQQTTPSSQPAGAQQPAMGHSEAMRHIEAIEAILSGQSAPGASTPSATTGTAGSTAGRASAGTTPTLNREQVDQIRTHLAELRKLLSQADRK